MIRNHPSQPAFTGGEMSPLILGRHDLERFLLGGQRVINFIARHQGPLVRRRGTQWIRSSDCAAGRLVNFERTCSDAEMLQIGCGEILVGATVPATPSLPVIAEFSQYDGDFDYEAHLLEGLNEHGETVYFRSAYVSGDNWVKGCQSPNSPGLYPCEMGDGVTNKISGLCHTDFSGGYQMFVDDATLRDPITGDPITDPLQCDVTRYGQLNAYNFAPSTGTTDTVGADDFSGLLVGIAGAGGMVLFEEAVSYTLTVITGGRPAPQYVFKYITKTDAGTGSFPVGPMSFIWCPGYEVDYRYTNMVNPEDLGKVVARTGTAARTQYITGKTGRTYTGTMSKAGFTIFNDPGATKLFGLINFTVTPDVGDPYTLSLVVEDDVAGAANTVTVDFPVINEAQVYLASWEFSHLPQVFEDFELLTDGDEVFALDPTTTWSQATTFMCPAPNAGCLDDFSAMSTDYTTVTAVSSGYGWADEGVITSIDGEVAYEEFESYTNGEIENFGAGLGWAAPGLTRSYFYEYAAEAFEAYAAGAVTVGMISDNSDLWGVGWAANAVITS